MKKIKGHTPTSSVKAVYKKESLPTYLAIFGKYFGMCGNCITNQDLTNVENAIFCFTKVRRLEVCPSCEGGHVSIPDKWKLGDEDPVWEHFSLNTYVPKFMNVEVKEFQRRLCPNSVIISISDKTRDRVIAEHCPRKNILLTTDWTHDSSKVQFVNEIFEYLESVGIIKRRKIEKKKPSITLGTDPELELIDSESGEIVDCSHARIRDRVLMPSGYGRIGRDGAGHQRELRPEPSDSPEGLIANIEKLIVEASDEKWSLKGQLFALGGHIHVGGVEVSWDFVEILDYFLFPLTELNSEARKKTRYSKIEGNLDRMREQPHGLEYRAPPSGWLASKELARITLKIVKLAAERHYSGDDVEITDNLKEDMVTLGLTREEVGAFFSEISKFKSQGLPDDLKTAWGYKPPRQISLDFKNGWSNEVMDLIERELKKFSRERNLDGRVVFFGTDREQTILINPKHTRGISLPEPYGFSSSMGSYKYENNIGIPSRVRGSVPEATKLLPAIKDMVLSIIYERDKKKTETEKEAVKEIMEPWTIDLPPVGEWIRDSTNGSYYYQITR